MARTRLTEKQERFCQLVGVEGKTLTDAYRTAYGASHYTAAVVSNKASALAAGMMVSKRIEDLREQRLNKTITTQVMTVNKLLDIYVQIALVDPNELVSLRVGCCRYCYGADGRYQWRESEYVTALEDVEAHNAAFPGRPKPFPAPAGGFGFNHSLPPVLGCHECRGEGISRIVPQDTTRLSEGARLLYRGVKMTRDGWQMQFADKDKALEQIGRMLGAFKDQVRVDIDARLAEFSFATSDPNEAAEAYQKLIALTAS